MRFGILGPIEVWRNGRQLTIGGPQQRALLAMLLLNANRVVSADQLVMQLWPEQPPPDARALLRGCVTRLRRALRADPATDDPAPDGDDRLVTQPPGYLLRVHPGELDLERFEALESAARQARAEASGPSLEQAARDLRDALALWRGPALDDLPPGTCRAQAAQLEEHRLAVLEQCIDIELCLGRHAQLVSELQLRVSEHPLREPLWAQLILALYAADRQADALAAYRQLRQTLVEQLGVEPSARLRTIERTILAGADAAEVYRRAYAETSRPEPAPSPAASDRLPPTQLPADVAGFIGRDRHLKQLDALVAGEGTAVVISAIAGTAGVGKTALAVHWAHRVRERFPDAQLYVDLRGYACAPPVRPIEALAGFLQALRVPAEQVPVDVEAAAGLYRTLLTDRRLLIVLDNARSVDQVRPLLPGSPGCLVIVTSRDRLSGLVAQDGAQRLALDVLTADEALGLLARLLSHERVHTEPDAVEALVRSCGYLPLALRIAAAALIDAPQRTIASYVAELARDGRLATLALDGDERSGIRATFDLSYDTLAPPVRRMFDVLGLVPGPDVTVEAAAALAGTGVAQARKLLDRLAAAHLLTEHALGRYSLHDLLREYAADRAATVPERDVAAQRLYDWYLDTMNAAARLLYPEKLRLPGPAPDPPAREPVAGFDGHAEAAAWLDAERPNLVAAVRRAAEHGPRPAAWQIADGLRGYFWFRRHAVDWLVVAHAALAAAESERDPLAQAAGHLSIADAHRCQGRYEESVEPYTRAMALARQTGWLDGEAAAHTNLGIAYWQLGRLSEAVASYTRSLILKRRTGRTGGVAVSLCNLGLMCVFLGRLAEAAQHHAEALALYRELGARGGEAVQLGNLGEVSHALGRFEAARTYLTSAAELNHEIGDRGTEADNLRALAELHRDAGRPNQAYEMAHAALSIAADIGNRRYEAEARNALGTVECRLGRPGPAIEHHQRALSLAEAGDPEVLALVGLATAHRQLGHLDAAFASAERAVALARRIGYRVLEGQALTALAEIHHARGEPERAAGCARQAVALQRQTGHRLGLARALLALGQRTEALALFNEIGAPEADVRHAGSGAQPGRSALE